MPKRILPTGALSNVIREGANRLGILAGLVLAGLTVVHFYSGLRPEGLGDRLVAYAILAVIGVFVFVVVWWGARLVGGAIAGTLERRK